MRHFRQGNWGLPLRVTSEHPLKGWAVRLWYGQVSSEWSRVYSKATAHEGSWCLECPKGWHGCCADGREREEEKKVHDALGVVQFTAMVGR